MATTVVVPGVHVQNQETIEGSPPVNQVVRIATPPGLGPGDSFFVAVVNQGTLNTTAHHRVLSVTIPETSQANAVSFIDVEVPMDNAPIIEIEPEDEMFLETFHITKAQAGACLAGGVVGLAILGPLGAVAGAGVGAYCVTRKQGKIGILARDVGRKTYYGIAAVKNKAEQKVKEVLARRRERRQQAQLARQTDAVATPVPPNGSIDAASSSPVAVMVPVGVVGTPVMASASFGKSGTTVSSSKL